MPINPGTAQYDTSTPRMSSSQGEHHASPGRQVPPWLIIVAMPWSSQTAAFP
jgi:hypothetical protein